MLACLDVGVEGRLARRLLEGGWKGDRCRRLGVRRGVRWFRPRHEEPYAQVRAFGSLVAWLGLVWFVYFDCMTYLFSIVFDWLNDLIG